MKTNKKQTVRLLRDVLCGNSVHNSISIKKLKRGYEVELSTGNIESEFDENGVPTNIIFHHCCNDCTLKEAQEELEDQVW